MAMPISDYERRRQANIADNKRILAALGLLDPLKDKPTLEFILDVRKKRKNEDGDAEEPPKKRVKKTKTTLSEVNNNANLGSLIEAGAIRRSARNQGKAAPAFDDSNLDLNDAENNKPKIKVPPKREKFYGAVPDVEIGCTYETRLEFSAVGVHAPTVAGIHGGPDGAYSIALSGGYEDDIDMGECFTYTGEGGRDLKGTKAQPKNLRTAPQSKDQTLTKGNLALSRNVETGNPVRVIRGYKSKSPYAPEEGYRYDGLYTVEKCWFTTGLSGYGVWKFAMKRCEGQAPPPWTYVEEDGKKSTEQDKEAENDVPKTTKNTDDEDSSDSESDSEEVTPEQPRKPDIPNQEVPPAESENDTNDDDAVLTLETKESSEQHLARTEDKSALSDSDEKLLENQDSNDKEDDSVPKIEMEKSSDKNLGDTTDEKDIALNVPNQELVLDDNKEVLNETVETTSPTIMDIPEETITEEEDIAASASDKKISGNQDNEKEVVDGTTTKNEVTDDKEVVQDRIQIENDTASITENVIEKNIE